MVSDAGNILNAAQQRQLTVLQATTRGVGVATLRLATGKDVNSALDNPGNFFTARSLDFEARDLMRLLDGVNKSIETVQNTLNAIEAMQSILNTAESYLLEYEQDFLAGEIEVTEILETDFFIEFDDPADFINYSGGQDSGAPVTLIEQPFGVRLDDNVWKRYQIDYTVTADTILEFDFRSSNIPEIAAIGFDNDNNFANGNTQFFLYGQQTTGITYAAPIATYEYDGSGDWVHVTIPVGTFFTGNFSHLTFINDDDGGGDDGDAQFRNMVLHEGEYTFGQTGLTVSPIYEEEYGLILDQLDLLALDSVYRGINLLDGDDMTTFFNAERSSSLFTEGIFASSAGLGLERLDFTTIEAVERKITQVREARAILRHYATTLSLDFSVLDDRADFTTNMINVFNAGRDDLTLADQNEVGAELLALQTRQQIQTSVLTINTASIADFLV